jgi:hypothetical protein
MRTVCVPAQVFDMITASRSEQSEPEQTPSFVSAGLVTVITAVLHGRAVVPGPQAESNRTKSMRDPKTIREMVRIRRFMISPWDHAAAGNANPPPHMNISRLPAQTIASIKPAYN